MVDGAACGDERGWVCSGGGYLDDAVVGCDGLRGRCMTSSGWEEVVWVEVQYSRGCGGGDKAGVAVEQ